MFSCVANMRYLTAPFFVGSVNLIHLLGSKSPDVGPDGSLACSSLTILFRRV